VNEITTFRWSFEEHVQNYSAAGVDGIAVWRQKLSDFGEEKGAELLAESGLAVSALQWAGGFTGSDGRFYRDAVQDVIEAVQLAGQLRADDQGIVHLFSTPGYSRLPRSPTGTEGPLQTETHRSVPLPWFVRPY
jgi:sugar phosphate isomerase/epimerase